MDYNDDQMSLQSNLKVTDDKVLKQFLSISQEVFSKNMLEDMMIEKIELVCYWKTLLKGQPYKCESLNLIYKQLVKNEIITNTMDQLLIATAFVELYGVE